MLSAVGDVTIIITGDAVGDVSTVADVDDDQHFVGVNGDVSSVNDYIENLLELQK